MPGSRCRAAGLDQFSDGEEAGSKAHYPEGDRPVAVHGGGRVSSSGIHWRSGIIVTAEGVLERDEDIKVRLPGGRLAEASLAGRDPTTDVAATGQMAGAKAADTIR